MGGRRPGGLISGVGSVGGGGGGGWGVITPQKSLERCCNIKCVHII